MNNIKGTNYELQIKSYIINEYNIPLDVSQNLLYTFEFPIVYNDMSYNSMLR